MKQRFVPTIASDFDDCIIGFQRVVDDCYEQVYGYPAPDPSIRTDFDCKKFYGLTSRQMWALFEMAYRRWAEAKVLPGAREFTRAMFDLTGAPLKIVTSRTRRFATETYWTAHRVLRNALVDISFADGAPKEAFLHGYTHYIEDCRRNALRMAAQGFRVFVVRRPWNQPLSNSPLFQASLMDRIEEIDSLGELVPRATEFVKPVGAGLSGCNRRAA